MKTAMSQPNILVPLPSSKDPGSRAHLPHQKTGWLSRFNVALGIVLVFVFAGFFIAVRTFRHVVAAAGISQFGGDTDLEFNRETMFHGGNTVVRFAPSYRNMWQNQTITRHDLTYLEDLHHVIELDLTGLGPVKDSDLIVLAKLPYLERLYLNRMEVQPSLAFQAAPIQTFSDKSLDYVAKSQKLRSLWLAENPITDDGLAKLTGLSKLEDLDLDGTLITDACVKSLVQLKSLKTLRIARTKMTNQGISELMRTFPTIDIEAQLDRAPQVLDRMPKSIQRSPN